MSRSSLFIEHLCQLADKADHDRAPLAAFRRGASGEPRDLADVYRYVLPHAPRNLPDQQAYLDVACLFGLHPTKTSEQSRAMSLGRAMREISAKSDSIEARFIALLQSHPEELLGHVRHCVSLARSNEKPLLWNDVLLALMYWRTDHMIREGRVGRSPQRRWAQDFWAAEAGQNDEKTSNSEETTT